MQTVIVIIIVIAAAIMLWRKLRKPDCNCGCDDCPAKNDCPKNTKR